MIEVNNLHKKYGPHVALDGISFSVAKGEVVGFLGPNGAGKTTAMRILSGYMPATFGVATVAGFDVQEESLEVRKRIGYLPENAPLYTDMDVLAYMRYVAKMRGLRSEIAKRHIKEVVGVCGLERVLGRDIGELSKGFKQRVGLAQALLHNPDILILDEPTSGLDPNQIVEIRNLIKNIGRKKTVILSTHIMQEVQATCQRMLIINEGKIVASGTHAELMSQHTKRSGVAAVIQGDSSEVATALRGIAAVKAVRRDKKEDTDTYEYLIDAERGKDVRADVFKLVVKNNWVLLGLEIRGLGLEDIFRKLTLS